ncbi:MAG: superoxide dismutase family protein, partial [Candidatus Omnitrophica bacterium]|nr:superoxide dismutase family protein [Candidatus Omnitrophota bacterium]
MMRSWAVVGIACLLASQLAEAENATAVISGTTEESQVSGTATLTDSPEGLTVRITVAGVSPGQHGVHIHQYGRCDDEGRAAGGHYNPMGVKHGFLPMDGFTHAHAGDFGNIDVRADGVGTLELTIPGLSLAGAR